MLEIFCSLFLRKLVSTANHKDMFIVAAEQLLQHSQREAIPCIICLVKSREWLAIAQISVTLLLSFYV